MALSLGAEGVDYLDAGQFQSFLSYRWLTADTGYIGTDEYHEYRSKTPSADLTLQSLDWNLTYGLSRRFSLSATQPFIYARGKLRHPDMDRHTVHGSGIGDFRLTANAWLWDPDLVEKGNVSLSLGFKAPTGSSDITDTFYLDGGGKQRRTVDIALQPGDGGWGIVAELQSFRQLLDRTYFYATGSYLANPRDHIHTNSNVTAVGLVKRVSVPDQYQARAGLSYTLWPHEGLAVSLGARIDGITQSDLIGNDNGFRRPGFSVYLEPGISLSRGKNLFSLYVPVALGHNRQVSGFDEDAKCTSTDPRTCGHGPGAFADYVILFSVSRRF